MQQAHHTFSQIRFSIHTGAGGFRRCRAVDKTCLQLLLVLLCILSPSAKAGRLPPHPGKLAFDSLVWEVPPGEPWRTVLDNGLRAYIMPDHSLPLVTITGYARYGSIQDPAGREGLGLLLAQLMGSGGTQRFPSDTLDMLLDLFAIRRSFSISETEFRFSFSFLSDYLDTAGTFIGQMLFHPAFEEKRVKKEKDAISELVRHRFDNPEPVLSAAYKKEMYPGQACGRLSTDGSIRAISRDDLVRLHERIFRPDGIIIGVSGRFDAVDMRKRLVAMFPAQPGTQTPDPFPTISLQPALRAVMVHKEITQAHVRIGFPLFKRPHDDYYAVSVMNLVLGGGGFSSRLNTAIRSDAGLTYSIYSHAESNYVYPATLFVNFQTKTESTGLAIRMALDEIDSVRAAGVTPQELTHARQILVESLPSMFRNADDIVQQYAWNEYYGRPIDIFQKYPAAVSAVTLEAVKQAAQTYLDPKKVCVTIVGDTAALGGVPALLDSIGTGAPAVLAVDAIPGMP